MKNILLTFTLVLLLASAVADAAKPIMNLGNLPVPMKSDGTSYTVKEVRAIIIDGCLARRWVPVLDGEGMIRATIDVRGKHFAEIEIPFTSATYSILYVSSTNLDYNEERQRIHRNYNNWVVKLSATINKLFRTASADAKSSLVKPQPDAVIESNQNDVYSELLRLDDLRDRGILTDEEFEAEKRELLQRD